eukprot:COSAG05_NODE_214_length_13907_cov_28.992178_10_plen_85_part_00
MNGFAAMYGMAVLRVELEIKFDLASFEIKDTHFSQQVRVFPYASNRAQMHASAIRFSHNKQIIWISDEMTTGICLLFYNQYNYF